MEMLCPVAPSGREVVREEGARGQAGVAKMAGVGFQFAQVPNCRGIPGPLSRASHCAAWSWKSHACLMEGSRLLPPPYLGALGRKPRAKPGREHPDWCSALSVSH